MTKLAKRYGKLLVIRTEHVDGTLCALVECTCGTRKHIAPSQLRAGRYRSCGAGKCRNYPKPKTDRSFQPLGPRILTVARVRKMWNEYHQKAGVRYTDLADKYGVSVPAVSWTFRNIRRCGGIDKYVQRVEE